MIFKSVVGTTCACLAAVSIDSNAAIIYDNFGPSDSFDSFSGVSINGTFDQGFQYIPTSSGLLTSLDVGIGTASGSSEVVTLSLYNDVGDNAGVLLESISVRVTNLVGNSDITSAVAHGSTELVAGEKYWIIAHYQIGYA